MKYLLLIYGEEATLANMTADEKKAYLGAFGPYTQDLVKAGVLRGGDPLLPTSAATSVRVRSGKAVTTHGPVRDHRVAPGDGDALLSSPVLERVFRQEYGRILVSLVGWSGSFDLAEDYPDERLKLLFVCCHPALPEEQRVALTLHTLGGLTNAEGAAAYLTPL